MTWKDIPGWMDFESYYRSVVECYSGGDLVEVGCYLGRSLCFLGQLVRDSGKPFRVWGVDWCLGSGVENGNDNHANAMKENGGSLAGKLHRNVCDCGLQDIVSLVVAESGRAAQLFADNSLTLVFLDARHEYADVCRDIELWSPKVRLGGEIGGDDYGIKDEAPVWPGVRRAVDEMLPGRELVPHDAWKWRKR